MDRLSLARTFRFSGGWGADLVEVWHWLDHLSWVVAISHSGLGYSCVEVAHYFSLFIVVGTVTVVDLRILGLVKRGQTIRQLAAYVFPVTWMALAVAIVSGFILFATDATAFAADSPFRVKMLVLLAALAAALAVQRGIPRWDRTSGAPLGAKVLACISLLLWIGTILAGVEVSALSGLG